MTARRPSARAAGVALGVALVPALAALGQIHPPLSRELDALAGAAGAAGLLLRFVPDLACAVAAPPRGGPRGSQRFGDDGGTASGVYFSFMRRHRNTLRPFM